ncbi:high mobility group box domain-containing protein, partial [Cunninghamella echinulata]
MLDIKELIEITKLRGKIKKRTRQRKRDPEKIPRPLNCFLLYRMEKQKQICELCPGANHRTISKIVAKWWKNISMSDKKKYMDAAKEAKTEHKSLYPDYRYVPRRKSS